jgi:long-chain acyl-CoA synthetase
MEKIPLKGKSLVEVLKQSSDLFADRVFLKSFAGDRFVDMTYREFADKAHSIGQGLAALGIQKGDRVGVLSENRPDWGASYMGVLFAGGINVPLDALLKIPSWSYILRSSGCRALIVSKNFLPEFELTVDDLPDFKHLICMDDVEPGSRAMSLRDLTRKGSGYKGALPKVKASETASILYTSGTTGQAKGVMLSHTNIVCDIDNMTQMIHFVEGDNFLSVLPIHHAFECTCGFLTPMAWGIMITYARGLASKQIIEDIKNNHATILLGVPLLYEKMHAGIFKAIAKKPPFTRVMFKASYSVARLLSNVFSAEPGKRIFKGLREKAGLSSLRLMVSGGAPMPPDIARTFGLLGFKFIQGYGLSETAPVLTLNPVEKPKDASIGLPVPDVELKIVDRDNRGIGQIVARGPMVMQGYFNNPEATAEVLKDGWLYTGDSGWVDEDGYYYIAGRVKNVIVTPAGKNVYPEEIEGELIKSPYILESLVLGRAPEGMRGEEIEAVVVPDQEYFNNLTTETGHNFTSEEIEKIITSEVQRLSADLAEFKRVKYVQIRLEEFEKTSTRKIKRYLFNRKAELLYTKNGKGRV